VVPNYRSNIDIPEYVAESFPDSLRPIDEVLNDTIGDTC
jgi:hypothetical protein